MSVHVRINCDGDESPAERAEGCLRVVDIDHDEKVSEAKRRMKGLGWVGVMVDNRRLDLCPECATDYWRLQRREG